MNSISGKLLPRSLSKVLPNKLTGDIAELLILFLLGAIAIALHAKLRIPTQMPGKYGMIYLTIIMASRLCSKYQFSATIASLGAVSLLMMDVLGFKDPFMPVIYIFIGIIIDILFISAPKLTEKVWYVALVGGIAWMVIPIIRLILFVSIGYVHGVPKFAPIVPFLSHFAFGCVGALLAFSALKIAGKSTKNDASV
ncbi:MAG: hypothetical protein WCP69_06660 [Bacteroidota bacterium]